MGINSSSVLGTVFIVYVPAHFSVYVPVHLWQDVNFNHTKDFWLISTLWETTE